MLEGLPGSGKSRLIRTWRELADRRNVGDMLLASSSVDARPGDRELAFDWARLDLVDNAWGFHDSPRDLAQDPLIPAPVRFYIVGTTARLSASARSALWALADAIVALEHPDTEATEKLVATIRQSIGRSTTDLWRVRWECGPGTDPPVVPAADLTIDCESPESLPRLLRVVARHVRSSAEERARSACRHPSHLHRYLEMQVCAERRNTLVPESGARSGPVEPLLIPGAPTPTVSPSTRRLPRRTSGVTHASSRINHGAWDRFYEFAFGFDGVAMVSIAHIVREQPLAARVAPHAREEELACLHGLLEAGFGALTAKTALALQLEPEGLILQDLQWTTPRFVFFGRPLAANSTLALLLILDRKRVNQGMGPHIVRRLVERIPSALAPAHRRSGPVPVWEDDDDDTGDMSSPAVP
ncbi:MAG: hypothetical protein AAGA56_23495 [Myxococcota bacterium]